MNRSETDKNSFQMIQNEILECINEDAILISDEKQMNILKRILSIWESLDKALVLNLKIQIPVFKGINTQKEAKLFLCEVCSLYDKSPQYLCEIWKRSYRGKPY